VGAEVGGAAGAVRGRVCMLEASGRRRTFPDAFQNAQAQEVKWWRERVTGALRRSSRIERSNWKCRNAHTHLKPHAHLQSVTQRRRTWYTTDSLRSLVSLGLWIVAMARLPGLGFRV